MCQLISNKFAPHLIYRVKTVELKQWTDRPWAVKKSLIHRGINRYPSRKIIQRHSEILQGSTLAKNREGSERKCWFDGLYYPRGGVWGRGGGPPRFHPWFCTRIAKSYNSLKYAQDSICVLAL